MRVAILLVVAVITLRSTPTFADAKTFRVSRFSFANVDLAIVPIQLITSLVFALKDNRQCHCSHSIEWCHQRRISGYVKRGARGDAQRRYEAGSQELSV